MSGQRLERGKEYERRQRSEIHAVLSVVECMVPEDCRPGFAELLTLIEIVGIVHGSQLGVDRQIKVQPTVQEGVGQLLVLVQIRPMGERGVIASGRICMRDVPGYAAQRDEQEAQHRNVDDDTDSLPDVS